MEKIKVTRVEARDFYGDNCLVDQINTNKSGDRKPQGEVQVYEVTEDGQRKLIHKSNLVVYLGREMLAQRLVDTDNTEPGASSTTKDEFVSWFGIGDGGVRPADPLDPVPPTSTDTDLSSHVMISDQTSTCGDYHVAGGSYPQPGFYKKQFDSVVFERDTLNDDKWLVIKIEVTIGVNDANGQQLSEAGIFSAESRAVGYGGPFNMFARVTFPSLIKTEERRLIFDWYLYV